MNENSVRNLIAGLFVIFMLFVMIFIGFFLSGRVLKLKHLVHL